jgi:hypothetical protein
MSQSMGDSKDLLQGVLSAKEACRLQIGPELRWYLVVTDNWRICHAERPNWWRRWWQWALLGWRWERIDWSGGAPWR